MHRIEFINTAKFMAICLSSLIDNLAKGLHKSKCKDCKSSLEYMKVNNGLLTFKPVDCKQNL